MRETYPNGWLCAIKQPTTMNLKAERRRQRIAAKTGSHIRIDAGIKRRSHTLTDEDISDMLWKHSEGISAKELGKIYGVHPNYIYVLKARLKTAERLFTKTMTGLINTSNDSLPIKFHPGC